MSQIAEVENSTKNEPFIESDAREDAEQLRERMKTQGYLFFRGLVASENILSIRRQVLELCAQAGWLDEKYDLMDGVARLDIAPQSEGMPDYLAVYRKVLRLPDFHDFPAQPALMQIAQILLQNEVFVHPRRMGRITFPNFTTATTPAHQDFFYIRGSAETYSCWIPLGECPVELGGLAIAPASNHNGFRDHTETIPGAVGGRGLPNNDFPLWHTNDFGLGDALFFHSHTVHKAMPNLTKDRLRLSTDNRYQKPKDDIHPDALEPHYGNY